MTNETEAPERIWAQDAKPDECDFIGGGWWDDSLGSTQYPHMVEYVRADLSDAKDARDQDLHEMKERYLLVVGDKINLRGRVAELEAECAAAWNKCEERRIAQEAAQAMVLGLAPLPLPRPDSASTWKLDPKFVMDVAHAIQREEGWDASMEAVELAMLAAEKHILQAETRRATRAEAAEAKLAKAMAFICDISFRAMSKEHNDDEQWLIEKDMLTHSWDVDITKARATLAELQKPIATRDDPA